MNANGSNAIGTRAINRRKVLGGGLSAAVLVALPACATTGSTLSMTEVIRRLLLRASENAFARLTAPDGYWDEQVARIGLGSLLGTRGDTLTRVLTSTLFKDRLETVFADIAIEGSYAAAPIVRDAVEIIGPAAAFELVRGGPQAATEALRGELGGRLIDEMVPELGDAIRIANDPLVAELLNAATGTDIGGIAGRLAGTIDSAIWSEIGREEAAIRANPETTRDPVLIGVFGAAARI
ncbi:hypothetical protein CD351_12565 [Erythrobacter sp. KY5]|uniref:DUF4197 domain-containing protein n=1 Tax=Erythrobacter sp. KY5 TaxID=2011159 RepID=UPI000DBF3304|nr:DUF4197 domain-containing protein [Erythrobacter sp. KY5]AWW75262.1 hypothetical protein CD351_12565 [Erythrobacter sp. KY5]